MAYSIEYLAEAEAELSGLPKKHIVQILRKIDSLALFPAVTGIKKLQGVDQIDLYRLRSGDYRIIFTIESDRVVILIVRIAHRKDVYR